MEESEPTSDALRDEFASLLIKKFGEDAVRVCLVQIEKSSGEVAHSWSRVLHSVAQTEKIKSHHLTRCDHAIQMAVSAKNMHIRNLHLHLAKFHHEAALQEGRNMRK